MSIEWKPLNDVQWMNIVNHDHCHESSDKQDAINLVFNMTEAKLKEVNEPAFAQMERDRKDVRNAALEEASAVVWEVGNLNWLVRSIRALKSEVVAIDAELAKNKKEIDAG